MEKSRRVGAGRVEGFGQAVGHRDARNPAPIILSRAVAKKDIAFVVNEREESELVLFAAPKRDLCEIITDDVAGLVEAR